MKGRRFVLFLLAWAVLRSAMADVDIPRTPEARQKGAETAVNVCLTCHGLKYLKYSDLAQLGFTVQQLDTLRGDNKPNEALQAGMDPAMLREGFGLLPPDLSLMAKAREGGPAYIYKLLTGFYYKDDGSVDNHRFPGVKMPDVLGYSDAKDPAQRAALEAQARNVAAFLAWAADPHAEQRYHLGYFVLAYLAVLTLFLYLSKRRIWARLN